MSAKAKPSRSRTAFSALLALPLAATVLSFFLLPYSAALGLGFSRGLYLDGALVSRLLPLAAFTFKQAALSTLSALLLGLPGALFISGMKDGAAKKTLRALTLIPFAIPPILTALGFTLFFGNAGFVNRVLMTAFNTKEAPLQILYRGEAVILAHAFYNFPIVIRLAGDALSNARRLYSQTSAGLGASPSKTALFVLLPLSLPSALAAALLVFLYCWTSFSLVLVLGGGPAVTTLAVEIYRYARLSLDYRSAGVFALTETAAAFAVFALYLLAERKSRVIPLASGAERSPPTRRFTTPVMKIAPAVYIAVVCVIALGPLIAIPVESLLNKSSRAAQSVFSLRWWGELENRALPALGRSLLLSSLSATLACFLAVLACAALNLGAARRPSVPFGIKALAVSPVMSSGIVLGLGFLVLYGRENTRSLWAAAAMHAVSALPFAFNSVNEGFAALPKNTMNAAGTLGAGPLRQLATVFLPLSLARLRSAWAFSALISLGELNAVMMLGLDWETLPILIYRAAGAYRYGTACAAGTLLIALCAGLMLLSEIGNRR